MSLAFNSNVSALTAHRALQTADSSLTKSIKRLSTGLRINGASDDPSGLAISQRLQTQSNGLERAIMNAEDGTSYLQTAESALNETQSILQKMRELSIQGANGTLTASDRQQLQQEVDQLKEEVDRIATSTEFNTKKLLDGTASVIWSTSSDDVGVIVRGKAEEGNYKLEIDTDPVENHVIKSDIFKVKEAAQGISDVDLNAVQASYTIAVDATTNTTDGYLEFDFGSGSPLQLATNAWAAGGTGSATEIARSINEDSEISQYVVATVDNTGSNLTIQAKVAGEEGNAYSVLASGTAVAGITDGLAHSLNDGDNYPTGVTGVSTPDGVPASETVSDTYRVYTDNTVFADGATEDALSIVGTYEQAVNEDAGIDIATTPNLLTSAITTGSSGAGDVTAPTGSGYAILEITTGATVDASGNTPAGTAGEIYGRVSFDNGLTWSNTGNLVGDAATADIAIASSDNSESFEIAAINSGTLNAGDKVLIALNDLDYNEGPHAEVRVDTPFVSGVTDTVVDSDQNYQNGPRWAFATDALNNKTTNVEVGYLNSETGDVTFGQIGLEVEVLESNDATNTDITAEDNQITFNVTGSSGPAYETTKLWQIDKFYDTDGNFILGESGKYITIYNQEGSQAEIYIDPEDTIGEVSDKIEQSITQDTIDGGLGMGSGDSSIDGHVCDYIVDPVTGTDEALQGTLVIRSPWMGTRGQLYFSADEEILNALSLATINSPETDPMTITVTDAHTGDYVGEDTVSDSVLRGVIDGVDVVLNPNLDVDVSWDSAKREFLFENGAGTVTEYVHIVDNSTSFQIGASAGQKMDNYIGEMTAKALDINNVMVVDSNLAEAAMEKLSNAIDKVSSERARMGAVMNRLEHTINNLTMQQESAIESNSRITDLDIASESVEFAKNQMMSQAAQAMLAQANETPQNLIQLLK